jgi:hypothetical protein
MLLLIFFLFVALICILILVWTIKNGISPAPTTRKIRKALNAVLPQSIEGSVVELGSGWGGMALFLARKYPNAEVIAFETSPIPWLVSKLRAYLLCQKNIRFERKDFFLCPLPQAQLFFCYLSAPLMKKLSQKLVQIPKAMIVSHTFALPGYTPLKIITADDIYHTRVYLYFT